MKIFLSQSARAGYTLVEFLVVLVTMVMVVGACMAGYIYGLRTVQYIKPKLGASDEARQAVSLLMEEIRGARMIKVGAGSVTNFTEVPAFSSQIGSAIQLYPSTNTDAYIRYFWDSAERKLKRTTNGMSSTYVVANSISNQFVFKAEDSFGNLLSNNYNNRIIAMELEFYQIQYPVTPVGPGNYYDFYQLRTKISRRTLF